MPSRLHDAVEDHAADIAPGGRQAALAVLAGRFGDRTAALVAAVTNPEWEPGRDEHEQYREHVLASLAATPWARVIKASDFADNAVGIIHTTGPRLSKLASKCGPLVSALRELILRPDTPLEAAVKEMIAAQLDDARARFTAIGPGYHGDSVRPASHPAPGLAPHSGHPDACHRGNGTGRDGRRARPPAAAVRASPAQGRQGPGDRGKELTVVVPPMPPGPAKSRTNSLWTCLTVSRFRSVTGWCQTGLDVPSDQVLRGSVGLGVAGRRWPLAAS